MSEFRGLLPRPITALKWSYTSLKPVPSKRLDLVTPTRGYPQGASQTQSVSPLHYS